MYLKPLVSISLSFLITALGLAQKLNSFHPGTVPPVPINGYTLVWNDEFNINGLPDKAKWMFEKGFVRNEELQWYQEGNASCINGALVIEGRRQQVENPLYQPASPDWKQNRKNAYYTSSSIQTKGHHHWTFGRFEIRARIDTMKGSWPAIWTLGIDRDWPSNGEIDIMEFYRVNDTPNILANVAWGTDRPYVAKWHTEMKKLDHFISRDKDWVKKFHTWKMDWSKDSINLYLDDELLNTTLLNQTLNPDGYNPFLQPHFLLLNLAIGGNGGAPVGNTSAIKYEVDYVRVYQKKEPIGE